VDVFESQKRRVGARHLGIYKILAVQRGKITSIKGSGDKKDFRPMGGKTGR